MSYSRDKPEDQDSIKVITDRSKFIKNPYRTSEVFTIPDSNAFSLESQISNNYSFLNKLFTPGEYIDNLEAYVLQMIFTGKEEEAWKYFDGRFPFLCRKQRSKERILETKQKIIDFKIG